MSVRRSTGAFVARSPGLIVLGIVVPLAMAGLAYGLWWVSDRLLYIGPLDRAAFGWIVVIPVWLAGPVVGALSWHRLPASDRLMTAAIVGITIGTSVAVLFWLAVAYPDCQFGASRTPVDWVLPSLVLGAVVGGGFAGAGLLADSGLRHGRRWRAVLLGAGTQFLLVFLAAFLGSMTFLGPRCLRPPL